MKTLTVRMTDGDYERLMEKAGGLPLSRYLIGQALGNFSATSPVKDNSSDTGDLERRVTMLEGRITALKSELNIFHQLWRRQQEAPPPLDLGAVPAAAVLPGGMTHRPDPLAGLRKQRLSKTKARKVAGCPRCADGCVPEVCCCGCHRKERGI